MHVIAAKAVAFREAMTAEFKVYQAQIKHNAKVLSQALEGHGFRLVSGGTDNHMMMLDLRPRGLTGRKAEKTLDKAGITVNKNKIPFDPEKPMVTSGIRIGTPAVTTRGMKSAQMEQIASLVDRALTKADNDTELAAIKEDVRVLANEFPLYADLLGKRAP